MTFSSDRFGLGGLERTLIDLRDAATREEVPFMLVGALARDLHLYHRAGELPPVQTNDVDLAVAVRDRPAFDRFTATLVDRCGWTRTRVEHRLRSSEERLVDVVPFGGIEAPPGSVGLGGGGFTMNVLGYREALGEAESVLIDGVRVALLPLRAYGPLKLLAWGDRGDRTNRDAEDLGRLLDRYFDLETEHIALNHSDLFDDDAFDTRTAGARAYGRDAAGFLALNDALKASVLGVLARGRGEDSAFVAAMGNAVVFDRATRAAMMGAFYEGLTEAPSPSNSAPAASLLSPR